MVFLLILENPIVPQAVPCLLRVLVVGIYILKIKTDSWLLPTRVRKRRASSIPLLPLLHISHFVFGLEATFQVRNRLFYEVHFGREIIWFMSSISGKKSLYPFLMRNPSIFPVRNLSILVRNPSICISSLLYCVPVRKSSSLLAAHKFYEEEGVEPGRLIFGCKEADV